MYFVWLLAAAGVVAAGIVIRRFFFGKKQRPTSMFQQGRPLARPTPAEQELQAKTQDSLLKIVSDESASSVSRPVVQQPTSASVIRQPVAAMASSGTTGSGDGWKGSSTIPMTGVNRISTWDDRRLFRDFRGLLTDDVSSIPMPAPEELPIKDDDYLFGSLTPSIAQLLPETASRREVQRKALLGAGYFSRAAWLNLTALRFVLAFSSMVIVGFWLIMAPPQLEPWLLGALILAPLFLWALPPLMVGFKASERKIDIERGLPDVLDMMNMGVSQGLTVSQSLKRISREIHGAHPALAEELRIVSQQADVGSLPQALKNFSQRIDSPEVNSFTSLLIQSEATGTSISRALTDYSDSMRATLKERADARANAASFKLLFPVSLFLMPSVFLFLLGPAIVQMSDFFNNQARQLQQNRQDAMRSLDQQPQLNLNQFQAGQFQNSQLQ